MVDNEPFSFEAREWLYEIIEQCNKPDDKTLVLKSRQVGASTLISALIIWRALKYPGCAQMYVCDTQDHMHDFSVDKLLPMIESSGDVVKMSENKKTRIRRYYFANGSRVLIMSAHGQFKQTRGPKIDFLYVDEAQSVEIDHMPVAEAALTTSKHKNTLVAGTGGDDGDAWWREWNQSTCAEWESNRRWVDSVPDAIIKGYRIQPRMNPAWTQAMDDRYRKTWTPYRYQTEWLAEFATGHALPFPHSLIIQSYYEGAIVLPHEIDRDAGPVYCSIDLAIGGDAYTVPVVAQHTTSDNLLRVLYVGAYNDSKTTILRQKLGQVFDDYKPDEIIMDAGGNPGLTEVLLESYNIQRYYMLGTQKDAIKYSQHDASGEVQDADTISKPDFIEKVKQRFELKGYRIPLNQDTEWTIKHLLAERSETVTPKGGIGRPRYSNKQGEPDDFLMALTFLEAHLFSKSDENNPHVFEGYVSDPI